MIRNLRTLGLALVAVLAMSAVVASAASAALLNSYHSAAAPTTVTGTQITKNVFTFPGAGSVECEEASFHGSQATATASELTIHPTYGKCKAFGFASAHVSTTGCDYTFTEPFTLRWAYVQIVCSKGNSIKITPTFLGASVCTLTVGSQNPGGHVGFTNSSPQSTVTATATVNLIAHSAGCGASEAGNGTYTGSVLMKGSAGAIWIT